jgi:hypothetical protein
LKSRSLILLSCAQIEFPSKEARKMKKQTKWLVVSVALLIGAVLLPAVDQAGELEPSAPPAPTMKTLDDIYSATSWSRKIPCDSTDNCPRFVVLSDFDDDAVLDKETGLVWGRRISRNASAQWHLLMGYCTHRNTGGRMGWHLPTIEQLGTLIDRTRSNPALPAGHPFEFDEGETFEHPLTLVSSTTQAGNPDNVLGMNMGEGAEEEWAKTNAG